MGAVWLQLRTSTRTGWRSMLALALLIALAGGAVLGALAGAHRTATAFDRMLTATNAADLFVNPDQGTDSGLTQEAIAAIPGVEQSSRVDGVILLPPQFESAEQMETFASGTASDGVAGYDMARANLISGRRPDPTQPFEVLADTQFATANDLEPGDTFTIRALTSDEIGRLFATSSDEEGRALLTDPDYGELVDLQIVGVGVQPTDLITEAGFKPLELMFTPAYWEHFQQPSAGWWGSVLRLENGSADIPRVEAAVQALVPDEPVAFQTQVVTTEKVQRTTRPYVAALLGFAAVAAILGLIVVAQAVARRSRQGGADQRLLLALGLGRGARFVTGMVLLLPAFVVGCAGAVLIGWLVSPIAPIGPVRSAEPASGLTFDVLVLGVGAFGLMVFVLVLSAIPVWRATRVKSSSLRMRPSRAARGLAAANGSPASVVGVRFALESGGGSSRGPTRAVLIGAASAIALAVALLSFGASLNHFVETPRLFGSDWNVLVDGDVSPEQASDVLSQVGSTFEANPAVEAYSSLAVSEIVINGKRVPTLTLAPSSRPINPTVLDGSAPDRADEIALGAVTADQLGLSVGDPVTVTDAQGNDHPFTLSSTMVLPEVGTYGGSDKTSLGEGALMSPDGFHSVAETFDKQFFVARVTGPDPVGTVRSILPPMSDGDWIDANPPPVPAEVATLSRLRSTPTLLLGMLVVLLGAAVVHALLVAFRARRHDVAILQALGYRPRQVVTTSLWQATTTAVVALVIGVPIGLIVGRSVWRLLVQGLAAVADPVTPVLALLGLTAAVFVLVNLLGLIPGWRASRRTPAEALRTE